MSRKNIRKFSWSYELVRWLTILYHRSYYRKLKVMFREKIPSGSPVILICNHQNALMDALSVVYNFRFQCVFMARADIFKKKMTATLLYFLKILPAYRIRDGFHAVDQNKEVFKEVISVLENNRPVALYPEGSHLGEKRLRQLKKGAARLALMTAEAVNFNREVFIVPVGLDYSNYYNAGSDLLIIIGDPIPVSPYKEHYHGNQVMAVNNLTADLAEAMRKNMIDISSEEHYQTIHDAVEIFCPVEMKRQHLKNSLWNNFRTRKELSEKIVKNINGNEIRLSVLKGNLQQYRDELKKNKIRDQQISNPISNRAYLLMKCFISLVLLPIHIYGMIANYIPYRIPIYQARNIKDPHFISSVRFGIGILTFFPWYLLLIILSFIILKPVLLSLAFIISLPLSGLFTFYYYKNFKKMMADFRWMRMKYSNRDKFTKITDLRNKIISTVNNMISN